MTDNLFSGTTPEETSPEEPYSLFDGSTLANDEVSANNFYSSSYELHKGKRLEQAKNDKLSALSKVHNKANLEDSYTDMGNGWLESNKNKIWNEESAQSIQSLNKYTDEKYGLTRDKETGRTYFKDGTEYTGRTKWLYRYGTKDWLSKAVKVGLARGDMNSADARYIKDQFRKGYGWESGVKGVDVNRRENQVLLPSDVAVMREALTHGRKDALDGRLVKDRFADPLAYDEYGSGASEYYKSLIATYGEPQEYDAAIGEATFNKYMGELTPRYSKYSATPYEGSYDPRMKDSSLVLDTLEAIGKPAANTLAAFGSTFVNELLVKPADALGDLTGLYDLGTEEELTNNVNDTFGYDPKTTEESIRNIGSYWDIVSNSEATISERVRAAGNGILEAFTTPEMLGTSFGALMAWAAPGKLLQALGKGAALGKANIALDKALEAGDITKSAARLQKAKNVMSVDGAKAFITKQSGMITSSVGNINSQYEQFVANNNGVGLSGEDKAKWFAGRFAVQMFNQNLDKMVDINVIKSPGLFAAAVPAIKAMTKAEFVNLNKIMTIGVLKSGINATNEAAQEYSQTMMELYNSRFGSEQFKELDTFNKFITNPDHVREAGISALAGAGGSGQFELVGSARQLLGGAAGLLGSNKSNQLPIEETTETPPTEDEIKTAKSNYGSLLARASKYTAENGVSENNIGTILDDLDELNSTKHIISTSSPEQQVAGEEVYNGIVASLRTFVKNNPDTKLTRKIVSKTVDQAKKDKDSEESINNIVKSTPKSAEAAFKGLAKVIGNGEDKDASTATKEVVERFKKDSFSDVVVEEGVIDKELQSLEKALTGKVSEDMEETFDRIKDNLNNKTPSSGDSKKSTKSNNILGSSPESSADNVSNVSEEVEYDDYSRAVDAERIYSVLLGSNATFDEGFKETLDRFARTNGVTEKRIAYLKKSYESVEEEALRGATGYVARLGRLKGLMESSNPKLSEIHKERDKIVEMQSTIGGSAQALTRGIEEAKRVAIKRNKAKIVHGKSKSVETEYKQYNDVTKKYDKPFNIWVSEVNGKWVARTEEAEKRLAEKNDYVKDISKELRSLNTRHFGKIPGFELSTGKLIVPLKEGVSKNIRERDSKYLDSANEIIRNVKPDSSGITKVILGKETHKKWDIKGEYHNVNRLIINNTDFTSDDVVLLDSIATYKKRDNFYEPVLGKEAKKSIKAAAEAGATFVLDHSFLPKKNQKNASILTGYMSRYKDYKLLPGAGRTILVKETADNKKAIKAYSKKLSDESKIIKSKKKNKSRLVTLNRSLALGINPIDGEPLSKNRQKNLSKEFDSLFEVVSKDSFKGNKENVLKHLANTLENEAKKEAIEILKQTDPDPLNYKDKAFQLQVEEFIKAENVKDLTGSNLFKEWSSVLNDELSQKEKDSAILSILEKEGLKAKAFSEEILNSRSFSKGKKDLYENVFKATRTGEIVIKPLRNILNEKQYKELMSKNDTPAGHTMNSKKHIFLGTRRVVQDATKLVNINKTTIANSVPIAYLPFTLREATKSLIKSAEKTLASVSRPELLEQTDIREKGNFLDGNLFLHNSPARGLIFNNQGEVNPEVATAIYLSLGELLVTDKSSLTRGFKSDIDVGKMFGVHESEVTKAMRDFSRDNGSPLKTVANSFGKNILAQLGMTKKIDDDIASGEYEALVADLGNTAIKIAEEKGLLEQRATESNKLAALYKDGEIRKDDALTHFINLTDREDNSTEYTKNVPSEDVEIFIEGYEEYIKDLPGIQTNRKEPHTTAPSKARLERAENEVRNDITNSEVPDNAKITLNTLMETEYSFDIGRVEEFLDAVDAKNSKVMELLGHVDLESDAFRALYYKDKEVQEGKNRDLEKSVEELRKLRDRYPHLGKDKAISLYFDYFYSSNDRYMLDSNTINPQVDKIHRFLVTPKAHELEYEIGTNSNGGLLFNVDGEDQSFVVRMAITQGLGGDVDKMDAMDIIKFGDAMLSMDLNQLKEAKRTLLSTGKFEIVVDNESITASSEDNSESDAKNSETGESTDAKAAHITHSLQAFDFLEKTKSADNNGSFSPIKSSLSLEFDSLTSGFANKIQQMPILTDMHLHFARVGILTEEYLEILRKDPNFKGEDVEFNPSKGHGVNDILSTDFFDSYKTMAKSTIEKLQQNKKQKQNLSSGAKNSKGRSGRKVFEILKPMLPGGDVINSKGADIAISTTLRNMFKDPFMIFNYSASINRIVKNLGHNVAHDVAKGIATADFNNPDQEGIKEIAKDLLDSVKMINPNTKKEIKSVSELQGLLLNGRLSRIKLASPLEIANPLRKGKKVPASRNLEQLLSGIVTLTYGEAVKQVFNESFKPFIEMQDAMNDSFKVSFRIFDKKRIDMLQKIQQSKPDYFLSAGDHAKVLEDLWDDFPWIVGPLSGATNKKDVISVVTTSARSPKEIESARKKPQAMLAEGGSTKSRMVSPIVRYLEEALSAGSVLPFHAIDGAEMSEVINEMRDSMIPSIAAIHDAIIAPLNRSDDVGFSYQKGMVKTNTDYVLVDKLTDMLKRIEKTTSKKNFAKEFKDVTIKGFKTTEEKSFPEAIKEITSNLSDHIKLVKKNRKKYYGKNGILEKAQYGNLVGTPGSMYDSSKTSPDLSYRDEFRPLYTKPNVVVGDVIGISGKVAPILQNVKPQVLRDMANTLGLPTDLSKALTIQEISQVLEADTNKLSSIALYYKNRKNSINNKDSANKIDKMAKSLSLLVADDIIDEVTVGPISEESTGAENNAAMTDIVENDLNTCKT